MCGEEGLGLEPHGLTVETQVLAILGASGEDLFLDVPNPISGVCPNNTLVLVVTKKNKKISVSHSVERTCLCSNLLRSIGLFPPGPVQLYPAPPDL